MLKLGVAMASEKNRIISPPFFHIPNPGSTYTVNRLLVIPGAQLSWSNLGSPCLAVRSSCSDPNEKT